MVRSYGGRVQFHVEDLGASPLGDRLGIDKYPAVFVDDALVARPEDFYAWGGPENGKYLPWKDVENRRKFQQDLRKLIDLRLAGMSIPSLQPVNTKVVRSLPGGELVDLNGNRFTFASLRGKPVIVEFWATWCPPCIETLAWLRDLDADVEVVALVVESPRAHVDELVAKYKPRARVVMTPQHVRDAFDGPPAVPTLAIADRHGNIVKVFYGAPKTLHEDVATELAKLD